MSKINIRRAVENIRATTTAYTPVVEVIVNAIQAIEETGRSGGKVFIRALRTKPVEIDGSLPSVKGFEIEDNGIGFNNTHRDSFDTLYTDIKITEGGKGFGRFICLKYFEDLHVRSVYREGDKFNTRCFSMGKDQDIIIQEKAEECNIDQPSTIVTLSALKKEGEYDKKLSSIAKNLIELLLPYFITQDYTCPKIALTEQDGSKSICLNDFVSNELSAKIHEIAVEENTFTLKATDGEKDFLVRVFKLYAPGSHNSRISLVAHKREASGSTLHKYIPEFKGEFYDKNINGEVDRERNYILKAYVFSSYLDRNVSLERGGFEFSMDNESLLGISQSDIEKKAAALARKAVGTEISLRQEKKKERIQSYVDDEAPWHKVLLKKIDLSEIPYNPTNEEIETHLQREKFLQEMAINRDVKNILSETCFEKEPVMEIVNKISDTSKNDLIHYIALRKKILSIFGKSLEVDDSGAYSHESSVHDIIFPRKGDTEITSFNDHNLWIVDERLNFTSYVSSDVPLNGKNTDRPDLLVYNKRVLFRGDNETSNPIMIFEFKRPQRDDFVNPSSSEDPVQQIVRYVNDIHDGKYMNPKGRNIQVAQNTPFYGYIVCDLTPKIEEWLERVKDFKPMPDRKGWFQWMGNINLYIEFISWDKVLNDAKMRNKVFFDKLGIDVE